ncbi:adenosylcobinamide-phosphate synthase CbiB [Tenacibaculum sp. M341]|uniref:adenosylcobinamide-phosphate synthase CbiB n=1 Tax=Tenacibaculum sp. M341 TaxID=2530339 RepID=UPI001048CC37|nr:adenosylcobinamide-phosphate synthase CbiB [Tenacibaculum sp. M341]TCI93758.1 cobalamin biosynthesis protein CobD [Tenacibaculum sp. M341]
MEFLTYILPLPLAYVLDLLLGDPRWLPHPIRLFGNLIYFGERKLNKNKSRFLKGAILTLLLTTGTFLFFYYVRTLLTSYPIAQIIFDTIFLFYALANKSLVEEGAAVFSELSKGIVTGRKRLSWIVGRDTTNLNTQEIIKAVFETLSENLSDGVIAPLFYYALFGVPGAMLYKMVNTLDSMIGYKNDRYINFGKFAAKLDDLFNYLPARLTAILMLLVTFTLDKIEFVWQQGKNHSSPNAGYPEAALAAILNCRFGGPNYYHGKLVDKPFIGTNERILEASEFKQVADVNHSSTFIFVLLLTIYAIFNSFVSSLI